MNKPEARKVALIQNRLQPGGRFQVMAQMIAVLNALGIKPDVWCFRSRLSPEQTEQYYGCKLNFNLCLLKPEPSLPFEWNIWWFNKKVSSRLHSYDLVINHNNTSYGLKPGLPLLSYVHFPRKYRLMSGLQDIHLPEGGKVSPLNTGKDFLNLMRWWYRQDKGLHPHEVLVANSKFTRQCLYQVYPDLRDREIRILYPPVDIPEARATLGKGENQMVSLGRIAPQKRQIEQIQVASEAGDMQLVIMGFAGHADYLARCRDRVQSAGLEARVKIRANVSGEERNNELEQARYFIHSMRNEPFGITTVQAIAASCIPLVHDSGGQREVIPDERLRYKNADDAVIKWRQLSAMTEAEQVQLLQRLQQHIQRYHTTSFRREFREILISLLHENS